MTRMTGPDCAVMCNLINTHTRTTAVVVVLLCGWTLLTVYLLKPLSTVYSINKSNKNVGPRTGSRFDCC